MAKDDDPIASAAPKAQYYSYAKRVNCANQAACFVAHAKIPGGKKLMTARLSCGVWHDIPLIGAALGQNPEKGFTSDDSPHAYPELPASGRLAAGDYLTSFNQEIVYRVASGNFPIVAVYTANTATTIRMSCILSGILS